MKWSLFAMAFVAGIVLPVQIGVNSSLRGYLPNAMQAAFISFAVGTVATLFYCFAVRTPWTLSGLAQAPWWAWLGGVLGGFYVWTTIVTGPKIGAAVTLGLIVAGQLIASLVLDHFGALGLAHQPISVWRVFGVLLVIAGVCVTVATSK